LKRQRNFTLATCARRASNGPARRLHAATFMLQKTLKIALPAAEG
jgi:hypothetical protein